MNVRLGRQSDDAGLGQMMSRIVMPGSTSISYSYVGSFFSALEAEGYDQRTLVGERSGTIVAAGSVTKRKVFLQGKPVEVGYLASLRIAPDARGSSLLARGYRLLGELQQTELQLPFYLTSIMRNNDAALRLLTSGRVGLPNYRLVGGYKTAVIPIFRNYPRLKDVSLLGGEETGIDHIFHCLEQYGSAKDCFTVFDRQELSQGDGMMKGIKLEDFIVAFKGSEPVGVVALWDQSSFRKMVVRDYSGGMRLASILDQFIGKFTGSPLLPEKEKPFAPRYLSCVAVKDNDPEVFDALLAETVTQMRVRKEKLLIAGFFEVDRLCTVLNAFFHIPFYSNIYAVDWDGKAHATFGASRNCYLDAGSL